jgi:predicted GNAT family acetyltransferase
MIRRFLDPASFRSALEPLLAAEPLRATILVTVLHGLIAAPDRGFRPLLLAAFDGETVVGACVQTPPYPVSVLLAGAGAAADRAATAARLGDAVAASRAVLPGFNGPRRDAEPVAAAYVAAAKRASAVATDMLLYRLGSYAPPPATPGSVRLADPADDADLDLLARWRHAFALEATHGFGADGPNPAAVLRNHAAGVTTLLWLAEDGRPVSFASHSAVVVGAARVGPVYTPPDERRHGYGAAVTAAAVDSARSRGAEAVLLFTDLANPTSNAIYRRLGFEPVEEFVELTVT